MINRDGNFGSLMKKMDGGVSTHRCLMIRLSKRVCVSVLMTDEYRTTIASPVCENNDLKMKCPLGNATKQQQT